MVWSKRALLISDCSPLSILANAMGVAAWAIVILIGEALQTNASMADGALIRPSLRSGTLIGTQMGGQIITITLTR